MKRRSIFSLLGIKLHGLRNHWVDKYIVHVWFKGWYYTTEDEALIGPYPSYKKAKSGLEIYCIFLNKQSAPMPGEDTPR